jgi:hypothetical protein
MRLIESSAPTVSSFLSPLPHLHITTLSFSSSLLCFFVPHDFEKASAHTALLWPVFGAATSKTQSEPLLTDNLQLFVTIAPFAATC